MKILYLTPSHIDYLSDQIYVGLCQNLGWDSIIDYPYKDFYHNPEKKVRSLPQNPGHHFQLEEIISGLQKHAFDFVVLSAIRKEPLEILETLYNKCPLPPLILLDGDDGVDINTRLFKQYRFSLYFKREYLPTHTHSLDHLHNRWKAYGVTKSLSDRTYPLPFSAILEGIPLDNMNEQDVDISFIGIASHRNRIRAVHILQNAQDLKFRGKVFAGPTTRKSKMAQGTFKILQAKMEGDPYPTEEEQNDKLSYDDYFQLLGRSKMGLSIRGAGFDTVRYWEIVASKRILVSEKPYIYIPDNFEHGKHALFCRPDLSDLLTLVRQYVHDQGFCKTMIEQAYQHLLRYHTCEQRAKQFLNICRQRL